MTNVINFPIRHKENISHYNQEQFKDPISLIDDPHVFTLHEGRTLLVWGIFIGIFIGIILRSLLN